MSGCPLAVSGTKSIALRMPAIWSSNGCPLAVSGCPLAVSGTSGYVSGCPLAVKGIAVLASKYRLPNCHSRNNRATRIDSALMLAVVPVMSIVNVCSVWLALAPNRSVRLIVIGVNDCAVIQFCELHFNRIRSIWCRAAINYGRESCPDN